MPFHVEALYCTRTLLCHPILCWWIRILIARDNRKSWEPWFCQNALILHFLEEWFVFNQHGWVYRVILTQKYLFLPLLWKPMCFVTFWLNMWAWRHRKNILMLRSDKISQMEIFHCTYWWLSMLDVEFYTLYNNLWTCDLMPILCHDFAMIFAIFAKVCRVFVILPWFSTVPTDGTASYSMLTCLTQKTFSDLLHASWCNWDRNHKSTSKGHMGVENIVLY